MVSKARRRYKKQKPSTSDQTRTEPSSASDDAPGSEDTAENSNNGQPKPTGRPIGTSDAEKRMRGRRENTLIDEIAKEYANEKKKAGARKLENQALGKIIQKLKSEHNLEYLEVPEDTIRSRYKRGGLSDVRPGHKSPMAEVEPVIVEIVKASNRARNPLSKENILNFANSLIEDGPLSERVATFKRRFVSAYSSNDQDGICDVKCVGNGWYWNFRRRWKFELDSGYGINHDERRASWTTWEWIEDMYDHIYPLLIQQGYAEELEEPEWQDRDGKRVDTEADALGSKVTHRLIHADRILVVDECGDNTNMKKDSIGSGRPRSSKDLVRRRMLPFCTDVVPSRPAR